MSILSNELFNTPMTLENVLKYLKDKPYHFYKPDPQLGYFGGLNKVYYKPSPQDALGKYEGVYLDIQFELFSSKLIVTVNETINIFDVYTHEIDCIETLIMIMDKYFEDYEMLGLEGF